VIATGAVSSLTGAASAPSAAGAADGAGSGATFNRPIGIASDGTNLYVADAFNNKIRKVVISSATVSSFTGAASAVSAGGAQDGPAVSATFNVPWGIASDGTNLYVGDSFNNKIRQIVISTGVVSSFTGVTNTGSNPGTADGASATATFNFPTFIGTDGTNVYVADTSNATIRRISSGMVSTLAGTPLGADGTGTAAAFNNPDDITSDGANLYVADFSNNKIRKIVVATGVVTTLAGTGTFGAADGAGSTATFNGPVGITTDGTNLYVTDLFNYKIRKIVIATGMVSSLTGLASTASTAGVSDGPGSGAMFNAPGGITTDGTNLYVVDANNYKIRKIVIASGLVSSFTGAASAVSASGATDGPAASATFSGSGGITTDGTNLYVADTNNNKIRRIVIAGGLVSSFTGATSTAGGCGAVDGAATTMATFCSPLGITSDGANLYVIDKNNNKIRKIGIATGQVSSVTGAASAVSAAGAMDGAGTTAEFNYPNGITTNGTDLFVADTGNNTVRKIQ